MIYLTGALTILFVGLRLCSVIDWAWAWVVSPILVHFCLILLIYIATVSVVVLEDEKRRHK